MSVLASPESMAAPVSIVDEWDEQVTGRDPLEFPGYDDERRGVSGEAVRTGKGSVDGTPCAVIESDFSVFGGSMGLVVGERVSRAFLRAADEGLPVVASVRTGGARMQEGMLSLIQMPRVVAAIDKHSRSGQLSVGVLQSPTTGGVFASWASLLDLRAAQADSVIGFAGPRVVTEMTGTAPPVNSHNGRSAFDAGLVDTVVADAGGHWVRGVIGWRGEPLHVPAGRARSFRHGLASPSGEGDLANVRAATRPSGLEWAALLCAGWTEIKGADPSVRAGLATIGGVRCVVVAMDRHAHGDGKARQTPAGYRLVQRAVELAGRLSVPVLTLIDTPGADPSPGSEAGGIAREIARTLQALEVLPTASVSLCVGEGGSGGAVALAHTDTFLMLDHAVFSVIGPEAAAVILWKDRTRAAEATAALRIDARSLLELGVCDGVMESAALDADIRAKVASALTTAVHGNRHRRVEAASASWLDG